MAMVITTQQPPTANTVAAHQQKRQRPHGVPRRGRAALVHVGNVHQLLRLLVPLKRGTVAPPPPVGTLQHSRLGERPHRQQQVAEAHEGAGLLKQGDHASEADGDAQHELVRRVGQRTVQRVDGAGEKVLPVQQHHASSVANIMASAILRVLRA